MELDHRHEKESIGEKLKKRPDRLNLALIGISVFVFLLMHIPDPEGSGRIGFNQKVIDALIISEHSPYFLKQVFGGEVFRLVTPVFLHFGLMHILFNMMWLNGLGRIFEYQQGIKRYAYFFIFCAIFPNLAQYLVQGPYFGGMSGVVYALLGYLWMYKRFHPISEFALPKADIVLMIGWFFLCLSGFIGHIANMAHAVGLGLGMLYGIWSGHSKLDQYRISRVSIDHYKLNLSSYLGDKAPPQSHKLLFSLLALFFVLATLAVEYWKLKGGLYLYYLI